MDFHRVISLRTLAALCFSTALDMSRINSKSVSIGSGPQPAIVHHNPSLDFDHQPAGADGMDHRSRLRRAS